MRAKRNKRYGKKRSSVSSKLAKVPAGLDWGVQDRNVGTLRKLEKSIADEAEFDQTEV